MKREVVQTAGAPKAQGPYSQAIIANGFVFTAGQVAIDPETGKLVEGDVAVQTAQALRNIEAVLKASGSSLGHVVKTTVFLKDMADFAAMNGAYKGFFPENPPARSTVQARPTGEAVVEIEVIALVP